MTVLVLRESWASYFDMIMAGMLVFLEEERARSLAKTVVVHVYATMAEVQALHVGGDSIGHVRIELETQGAGACSLQWHRQP